MTKQVVVVGGQAVSVGVEDGKSGRIARLSGMNGTHLMVTGWDAIEDDERDWIVRDFAARDRDFDWDAQMEATAARMGMTRAELEALSRGR